MTPPFNIRASPALRTKSGDSAERSTLPLTGSTLSAMIYESAGFYRRGKGGVSRDEGAVWNGAERGKGGIGIGIGRKVSGYIYIARRGGDYYLLLTAMNYESTNLQGGENQFFGISAFCIYNNPPGPRNLPFSPPKKQHTERSGVPCMRCGSSFDFFFSSGGRHRRTQHPTSGSGR